MPDLCVTAALEGCRTLSGGRPRGLGSRRSCPRVTRPFSSASPPLMQPTPQAIQDCILVLEALLAQPHCLAAVDLETRNRLVMAAGRVSRPARDERRLLARAVQKK